MGHAFGVVAVVVVERCYDGVSDCKSLDALPVACDSVADEDCTDEHSNLTLIVANDVPCALAGAMVYHSEVKTKR